MPDDLLTLELDMAAAYNTCAKSRYICSVSDGIIVSCPLINLDMKLTYGPSGLAASLARMLMLYAILGLGIAANRLSPFGK